MSNSILPALCILFSLFPEIIAQPYGFLQQFSILQQIMAADFNADGTLAAVCLSRVEGVQVYRFNETIQAHELIQTITDNPYKCYDLKMTPDGEWMVVTDYQKSIIPYKWNSASSEFELFQSNLNPINEGYSYSGTISNDHQYIFYPKSDRGKVHVFKLNAISDQYQLKETKQHTVERIWGIVVSSDNSFFAYTTLDADNRIEIFRFDGMNYTHHQTISITTSSNQVTTKLSSDDEYLTVTMIETLFYLYKFNPNNLNFELVPLTLPTYTQEIWLAVKNDDFLIVSEEAGVHIYSIDNSTYALTEIQTIPPLFVNRKMAYISHNSRFIIVAQHTYLFDFWQNCNFETQGVILDSSNACFSCGTGCSDCDEVTGCSDCSSPYVLNNAQCEPAPTTQPQSPSSECEIHDCLECQNSTHCSKCSHSLSEIREGRCCSFIETCHSKFALSVSIIIFLCLALGIAIFCCLKVLIFGRKNRLVFNGNDNDNEKTKQDHKISTIESLNVKGPRLEGEENNEIAFPQNVMTNERQRKRRVREKELKEEKEREVKEREVKKREVKEENEKIIPVIRKRRKKREIDDETFEKSLQVFEIDFND